MVLRARRPRVAILDAVAPAQPGRRPRPSPSATRARTCCCSPSARRDRVAPSCSPSAPPPAWRSRTQARDVLNAIHLASRGMQLTPRDGHGLAPRLGLLTAREADVLAGLQRRRSNAQIAAELHVSDRDGAHARAPHLPQARCQPRGASCSARLASLAVGRARRAVPAPGRAGLPTDRPAAARPRVALDSADRDGQRDRAERRPSRRRRLLRVDRARAAPGAARPAGRRRGHRTARGRHDRQLRGAPLRRRLGDAGLASTAPVPAGGVPRAGLPHLPRGLGADDGDRPRHTSSGSRSSGSTRPTCELDGLFSPRAAMRRLSREIRAGSGSPARSGSARTSSSRRSHPTPRSRLGSSCSAASRRASASRCTRRASCRASARRRRRGCSRWARHARRARGRSRAGARRALRPEPRPGPRAPRALRAQRQRLGSARKVVSESRERTFDTDISDPARMRAIDARDGRVAVREPRAPRPQRPHDRASRSASTTGRR